MWYLFPVNYIGRSSLKFLPFVACSLIAAECNSWVAREALVLVCGAACLYQRHYEK